MHQLELLAKTSLESRKYASKTGKMAKNAIKRLQSAKNWPKISIKLPKITMKHLKQPKKGDFVHQNGPFSTLKFGPLKKNQIFLHPSSRPVRVGRFAPPNFDRGLKMLISSDDRRAIKNDHLQSQKVKKGPFCTLKFDPLKKEFLSLRPI